MQDPHDDNIVRLDQVEDQVSPEHQSAELPFITRDNDRIGLGSICQFLAGLSHFRDKGCRPYNVVRRNETTDLGQIPFRTVCEEASHPRLLITPERLFQTIKNIVGGPQIAGLHVCKTFT